MNFVNLSFKIVIKFCHCSILWFYLVEAWEKMKSREEGSLLCVGRGASGPLSNKIHPDLTQNYTNHKSCKLQIILTERIYRIAAADCNVGSFQFWHSSHLKFEDFSVRRLQLNSATLALQIWPWLIHQYWFTILVADLPIPILDTDPPILVYKHNCNFIHCITSVLFTQDISFRCWKSSFNGVGTYLWIVYTFYAWCNLNQF